MCPQGKDVEVAHKSPRPRSAERPEWHHGDRNHTCEDEGEVREVSARSYGIEMSAPSRNHSGGSAMGTTRILKGRVHAQDLINHADRVSVMSVELDI
jgi:hypothetical protein